MVGHSERMATGVKATGLSRGAREERSVWGASQLHQPAEVNLSRRLRAQRPFVRTSFRYHIRLLWEVQEAGPGVASTWGPLTPYQPGAASRGGYTAAVVCVHTFDCKSKVLMLPPCTLLTRALRWAVEQLRYGCKDPKPVDL